MALQEQILAKLGRLEAQAEDPIAFWLQHAKYLSPDTSEKTRLHFLHPGGVSPLERPIYYHECEFCNMDAVFHDPLTDMYTCHACGECQETSRTPFLRLIPDSSIYKHAVHLHQILHEMQCLRDQLPKNLVEDVRDHVGKPFSYLRIKRSLRRLGYPQHYSMIYSIQQALDPTFTPLQLTAEQEECIQGKFFQYIQLGPLGGRKNRLNYHFVLGKIATLCGFDFIHPYLHPPTGQKSVSESEVIWNEVCTRLMWPNRIQRPGPQHNNK